MAKLFTLQEAQGLVPRLEAWLRSAIEAKEEAQEVDAELNNLASGVAMAGGSEVNLWSVVASKSKKSEAVARFKQAVERIQNTGCLIKDLDIGLLDFPAELEGQEVYLCWKLGEERIEYWHDVDGGFAGRKPIDGDMFGSGEDPRPN